MKYLINYNKFNENLNYDISDMISETRLYMGDKLKAMLTSMPYMMSNMILNKELTDIKDDITFVELSDEVGKLNFTRLRNVDKLIDDNNIRTIKSDEGEIIKLDSDNLPSDLYPKLIDNFTKYGGTFNEIGLGKFIRKVLGSNITDKDIEIYTDRVKSYFKKNENKYEFKLLNFDSESSWEKYFNSSFMKVNSEIHKSCMNDKINILRLYSRCNAKLLVLVNNDSNMILGRAVIWDVRDNNLDFDFFMDRIYIGASWVTETFKSYANKKKWAYKESQDYTNKAGVVFNGEVKDIEMEIRGDFKGLTKYPYMDTFSYLINNDYLSNFDLDAKLLMGEVDKREIDNIKVLISTKGGYL